MSTPIYTPSTSSGGITILEGQVIGPSNDNLISGSAVLNKTLIGLSSNTGALSASDSILAGFGKLAGANSSLDALTAVVGTPTSSNTADAIVKRGAAGEFSAEAIESASYISAGGVIQPNTNKILCNKVLTLLDLSLIHI